MFAFHRNTGENVKLSNQNRTASRKSSEFNCGLVFSSSPLGDGQLFEVRIDKKIESWIGSLEIGVTSIEPDTLDTLPSTATDLKSGTWVLCGRSIVKDGWCSQDKYSLNVDKLVEGQRIGVMKTHNAEIEFYLDGISHGVAATEIPSKVYAVVDLFGKIAEISLTSGKPTMEISDTTESETEASSLDQPTPITDRLRFHERSGNLVKLSGHGRSAERLRPLDEFNNAVVMSQKPLPPDVLFEIRIDRLVEKWSGSIEVGVTTHDPATMDFPATMTNMRSGTVMMSGCGILTNGIGTKQEYGEFNLDELRVGDRIGMMRKSNADLHYYINGLDQGIAASRVPATVWGVVDLYGMTAKVTIVDRDEKEEQNLITRRNTVLQKNNLETQNESTVLEPPDEDPDDTLTFHPSCGSHAAVINNGHTAHRPNALDDFNNAVVLTSRPLKINEVFEVRIDKLFTKWAGSIEIGVTTHAPTELEYPSTMTNVRSGTWIMTGNGVMHNGTSFFDDYGQNLDKLQVGDRVGVVLRDGGSLHFMVNGEDQGEAGTGLPSRLYGVADLYGQATQVTIVAHCPSCSPLPSASTSSSLFYGGQIHFHSVHGRNVRITNGGRTASRPRALVEFNDAIAMTNRPLKPGEIFNVVVERLVDRWSGSIEAGVTAIRPEELELPGTMTDLDRDTWILSGFAVMKDGVMLRHGYPLDLEQVRSGSIIGIKRHDDGGLHFYLDGIDQGEACGGLPETVYPIIDLYGQCAQVSIVSSPEAGTDIDESLNIAAPPPEFQETPRVVEDQMINETSLRSPVPQTYHKWHEIHGKGIKVSEGRVVKVVDGSSSGGLVFSSQPLVDNEFFEFEIDSFLSHWAGSLRVGVTTGQPTGVKQTISALSDPVWFVSNSSLYYVGNNETVESGGGTMKELVRFYCPSLEWLRPGSRVGVKKGDSTVRLYLDGVDQGLAAWNVPKKLYVVIELSGSSAGVKLISKSDSGTGDAPLAVLEIESPCDRTVYDSSEACKTEEKSDVEQIVDNLEQPQAFRKYHGRNVRLSEQRTSARRVSSYNQGLVLGARPLLRFSPSTSNNIFQVRLESLNSNWVSSLSIGVTSETGANSSLPVTALGLKRDTFIVSGDSVFHNGHVIKRRYGVNLEKLTVGSTVGVSIDLENQLHVYVNGRDQGVAVSNVPLSSSIPVVDLYGMCDQICVVDDSGAVWAPPTPIPAAQALQMVEPAPPLREKGHTEVMEKPTLQLRSKSDKMNENIQCCAASASSPSGAVVVERRPPSAQEAIVKSPVCSPLTKGPNCDYLSVCLRLKNSLGLPSGYFRKEMNCGCVQCSPGKNSTAGWTALTLRRRQDNHQPSQQQPSSSAKWDEAFALVDAGHIRRVLDLGRLLAPAELNCLKTQWSLPTVPASDSKIIDDSDPSQIVLSPVLPACHRPSLNSFRFVDPKTKRTHWACAAFSVLVRADAYKVASPNEWVTKERNATSLTSLLLRLEHV